MDITHMSNDEFWQYLKKKRADADVLLQNIKRHLPELEKLLESIDSIWFEDRFYRFYHHSYKVYRVQERTIEILGWICRLKPEGWDVNRWFMEIVLAGTGHKWKLKHNGTWTKHTRPILEAMFHSMYMLRMIVKYGKELEKAPDELPTGWGAVLYLYDLR